jgi:hypothetical protein
MSCQDLLSCFTFRTYVRDVFYVCIRGVDGLSYVMIKAFES